MTAREEKLYEQLLDTLTQLQTSLRVINKNLEIIIKATSTTSILLPSNTAETIPLEQKITAFMKEIGIPSNVKGYYYIKDVIIYCMDFDNLPSITQEIYPIIAKKYQISSSKVERCIRNAIEIAWSRGNCDCLHKLFEYNISSKKGRPTNSQFIACIVNELKES